MGSILSRVDNNNPWHDNNDATFTGGVKAGAAGKSAGAGGASTTKSTAAVSSGTGRLGVIPSSRRNVEVGGSGRVVAGDKRYFSIVNGFPFRATISLRHCFNSNYRSRIAPPSYGIDKQHLLLQGTHCVTAARIAPREEEGPHLDKAPTGDFKIEI